jgi:hypothetical protein
MLWESQVAAAGRLISGGTLKERMSAKQPLFGCSSSNTTLQLPLLPD